MLTPHIFAILCSFSVVRGGKIFQISKGAEQETQMNSVGGVQPKKEKTEQQTKTVIFEEIVAFFHNLSHNKRILVIFY